MAYCGTSDPTRIFSSGDRQPIATNETPQGRAENRRATAEITGLSDKAARDIKDALSAAFGSGAAGREPGLVSAGTGGAAATRGADRSAAACFGTQIAVEALNLDCAKSLRTVEFTDGIVRKPSLNEPLNIFVFNGSNPGTFSVLKYSLGGQSTIQSYPVEDNISADQFIQRYGTNGTVGRLTSKEGQNYDNDWMRGELRKLASQSSK